MMKKYYHATPMGNYDSICEKGIFKGWDGVVYLTEKPEEATRFLTVRGYREILVCEVLVDECLVEESFDHSEEFFKCRAYMYPFDIGVDQILSYTGYEVRAGV